MHFISILHLLHISIIKLIMEGFSSFGVSALFELQKAGSRHWGTLRMTSNISATHRSMKENLYVTLNFSFFAFLCIF